MSALENDARALTEGRRKRPPKHPDLRRDHDEKAAVENDGTLYRKASVVQVWWGHDAAGRPFTGVNGRETWYMPNEAQAKANFKNLRRQWQE